MDDTASPPLKVRKWLSGDTGLTSDKCDFALGGDTSLYNDGFMTVFSRRAKRKAKEPASSRTSLTAQRFVSLRNVLVPGVQINSLSSITRLKLLNFLQAIAPDESKEFRV